MSITSNNFFHTPTRILLGPANEKKFLPCWLWELSPRKVFHFRTDLLIIIFILFFVIILSKY